jgi:hypothetical protein
MNIAAVPLPRRGAPNVKRYDSGGKRPGKAETCIVALVGAPGAEGGPEVPQVADPGTAADDMATIAISGCPRRAVPRRTVIALLSSQGALRALASLDAALKKIHIFSAPYPIWECRLKGRSLEA